MTNWDDELTALVDRVLEQFGEDVVLQAVDRAFADAVGREEFLRPSSPLDGLAAVGEALKTELRRLARPH